MPLYEYVCDACGHRQEHLQKKGQAPVSHCPQCQAASYRRCLSAPAFVLKGSGWYVTDFRSQAAPSTSSAADTAQEATSSTVQTATTDSTTDSVATTSAPSTDTTTSRQTTTTSSTETT